MWRAVIALILAFGTDGSRITTSCMEGSKDCEGAPSFMSWNGITKCCKSGAYMNYEISNNNGVDNSQCLCSYGAGNNINGLTVVNGEIRPMTEAERKAFESRMHKWSTEFNSRMNKWSDDFRDKMNKWSENFNGKK